MIQVLQRPWWGQARLASHAARVAHGTGGVMGEREKYFSPSLLLLEREDIRLRVATLLVAGGT